MSFDNAIGLGAERWRHLAFVEGGDAAESRWLMSSDVCKHCTDAACLDVCPTGASMRTEFGTVVVQEDICNGCGYCVPACPFGVLDRREDDGRVFK
jgi:formate dehydrogenase iron-sulfur subunit